MSGETFGQMLARFRMAKVERQRRENKAVQWWVTEPLSQNGLALRANVDPAYVNRLEQGERESPKRAVVVRLAEALDLSPIDKDRLLIAAGWWPWSDPETAEHALAGVHGDFYSPEQVRRATG